MKLAMKPISPFQSGISLVELVAFIVIVSVAMVGLIGAYSKILARAPTAAQITRATQLAQERMELILSQKDVQGYASLTLDPCPASAVCPPPAQLLAMGFIVNASGVIASAPWPANPVTSQYRLITVTVTDTLGTQLGELKSVLANY